MAIPSVIFELLDSILELGPMTSEAKNSHLQWMTCDVLQIIKLLLSSPFSCTISEEVNAGLAQIMCHLQDKLFLVKDTNILAICKAVRFLRG